MRKMGEDKKHEHSSNLYRHLVHMVKIAFDYQVLKKRKKEKEACFKTSQYKITTYICSIYKFILYNFDYYRIFLHELNEL